MTCPICKNKLLATMSFSCAVDYNFIPAHFSCATNEVSLLQGQHNRDAGESALTQPK